MAIVKLLQDIADSDDGPQICALFDFDGTIISGYSASAVPAVRIIAPAMAVFLKMLSMSFLLFMRFFCISVFGQDTAKLTQRCIHP